MKNTTDIGGQLENLRARVTRANLLSWIAVVLAFTGGAYANHLLVFSSDIVDGEVKTLDLATSAVTNSKIAASAVTNSKIAASAVTGAKIATNAVTGAKIAAGAVTSAKIASNAVTGAKVTDGTLTSADIDQSTLEAIDALTLNGRTNSDLSGVGSSQSLTLVQDLTDCSPGFDYAAHAVVDLFLRVEAGGKVTGQSPDNGCQPCRRTCFATGNSSLPRIRACGTAVLTRT